MFLFEFRIVRPLSVQGGTSFPKTLPQPLPLNVPRRLDVKGLRQRTLPERLARSPPEARSRADSPTLPRKGLRERAPDTGSTERTWPSQPGRPPLVGGFLVTALPGSNGKGPKRPSPTNPRKMLRRLCLTPTRVLLSPPTLRGNRPVLAATLGPFSVHPRRVGQERPKVVRGPA